MLPGRLILSIYLFINLFKNSKVSIFSSIYGCYGKLLFTLSTYTYTDLYCMKKEKTVEATQMF